MGEVRSLGKRKRRGRDGSREWIGGLLTTPIYVTDADRPHRVQLAAWVELPDGLVVAMDPVDPETAEGSVGRLLAMALREPLIGSPRRPERVRIADPSLMPEVRRALGHAVAIEIAPTPELDELLDEMMRTLPPSDEEDSYLEEGRVPPALAAHLFRCAERLHRAAPWNDPDCELPIRLDIPELGVEGACIVVIGSLAEERGLLIFPSLEALDAFESAAVEARRPKRRPDLGTTLLSLEFERGASLAKSMRREVAAHGWPVASSDAFPVVSARERDGAPRPLEARDVRIAAASASAVASFSLTHRGGHASEPRSVSYRDETEYGVTARLTLPYEAFDEFESPAPEQPPEQERPPEPSRPRVARNAPCPCGSGKKYKKCHLPIEEAELAPRRRSDALSEIDLRLTRAIHEFAASRFGERFRAAGDVVRWESGLQLTVPFAAFIFRIDGVVVVDHYLAERGNRLSGAERAWLDAQREAWLSIWEARDVTPGEGLTLVDLLTGEQRRVVERTASRTLVARDAVLARVVSSGDVSLICGLHPRALSPSAAAAVVASARRRLRLKGSVPPAQLRDETCARFLIGAWERRVRQGDRRAAAPPSLRNTDGHAFLFTADRFDFDAASRSAVRDRLGSLEGAQCDSEDGPTASFVFTKPGNSKHRDWENTIVGSAHLSESKLRLETNSRERADELRARVEAACGDLIRHRTREHADPTSQAAPTQHTEPREPTPEERRITREVKDRHYREWLDLPVPALSAKTPRQAARTTRGRAALAALLKEFENHEAREERADAYDFAWLRRELGID
ncbi:MAG TPA: SEC-C domain-containing protein [Myxococcota bacterium]|nr:SEC-C domain-containing protein [Myxococcota bacterium]